MEKYKAQEMGYIGNQWLLIMVLVYISNFRKHWYYLLSHERTIGGAAISNSSSQGRTSIKSAHYRFGEHWLFAISSIISRDCCTWSTNRTIWFHSKYWILCRSTCWTTRLKRTWGANGKDYKSWKCNIFGYAKWLLWGFLWKLPN